MARIPPVRVRDEASASLLGRLRHPSRPHGSLPGALDHFRGGLGRLREGTRGTLIGLSTPLSLASSFRFPLQSAESRREIAWGALLLVLLPGIGWFLNMGHRIVVVHRMQHGEPPWPAWKNYPQLLGHGLITFGDAVLLGPWPRARVRLLGAAVTGGCGRGGGAAGGRHARHTGLHVSLLSRVRSCRDLQSPESARQVHPGRDGLLARLAHHPVCSRRVLQRPPCPRRGLPLHQRVVLAGRGVLLRQCVHATLRARYRRGARPTHAADPTCAGVSAATVTRTTPPGSRRRACRPWCRGTSCS